MRLLTIGVYGSTERSFFDALKAAGVDTFVDIRRRRGVRGSDYAYVNATRLQARLEAVGIRYVYVKELAPTEAVRDVQRAADARFGTAKRDRSELSDEFVAAYRLHCLRDYSATQFARVVQPGDVVCLFCVERHPEACHRSLAAGHVGRELGIAVEHLHP